MRSGRRNGQLRPLGFPIRKSSDHSLVADSPRLIAGSNVLHRLLVPRHPPCALKNLAYTTDILLKMLASTMQFSRYGRHKAPPPHPRWKGLALAEVPGLCFPHYCVYTGRFPQDPTACSSSRLAWQLVPCRPAVLARTQRRDVLAAALRGSRMNNQCSTRKAVDAEADDRCLTAPGAP